VEMRPSGLDVTAVVQAGENAARRSAASLCRHLFAVTGGPLQQTHYTEGEQGNTSLV